MKEVLTWGEDMPQEFDRLNIKAKCTYEGGGTTPSVYELTEDEFLTLCEDPEENWEGKDAAWRWADGCNLGDPEKRASVNGHWMYGWSAGKFTTLLGYLCEAEGISTERNVAAATSELAQANGLTIGALFTKYQPTRQ